MIENSVISHRSIYDSFSKFQRSASDHKFRTKSIRIKTVNQDMDDHLVQKIGLPVIYPNQSLVKFKQLATAKKFTHGLEPAVSLTTRRAQSYKIIEKNFEEELNNFGVNSEFLLQFFLKKCQETETKFQEHKYQVFLKTLAQRLCRSKSIIINQMGFGHKSLDYFFEWYASWDSHISELNLSFAQDLLRGSKMKIIKNLLESDKKLMKLMLCNSSLEGTQIKQIFELIVQQKRLFALDISNLNSQNLNRFGSELYVIQSFFSENQSVAIARFDNIQIRKEGFEHLCRGVTSKRTNPLKILSIADNHISGGRICDSFCNLVRSGLTHLDLSYNPLGEQFFQNLPIVKQATLKQLSLCETNMTSQNLYKLFQKLEECKTLMTLKLDNNNFSHHWFGKIGQRLEVNSSIQWLSMNNCQIKYFLPFFNGLIHNKYLKRLDASGNFIDRDNLVQEKIRQFFLHNKFLEEFRIKFCNISEELLVWMFEGMRKNRKLRVLDISENTLEDLAATNILKMLDENNIIEEVGIEKLQLSQQMKRRITMKLEENTSLREKDQFSKLKGQTKEMKAKDTHSWQDLQSYEKEELRMQQYVNKLQEKTQKLEKMMTKKKQDLTTLIKKNRDEESYLQKMTQNKLRLQNEKASLIQSDFTKLEQKQLQMKVSQQDEQRKIKQLIIKIRQTNEQNKKKQNQLEDRLRNHRYLSRKKSKNVQLVELSPKKYSIHSHTHSKK